MHGAHIAGKPATARSLLKRGGLFLLFGDCGALPERSMGQSSSRLLLFHLKRFKQKFWTDRTTDKRPVPIAFCPLPLVGRGQ